MGRKPSLMANKRELARIVFFSNFFEEENENLKSVFLECFCCNDFEMFFLYLVPENQDFFCTLSQKIRI